MTNKSKRVLLWTATAFAVSAIGYLAYVRPRHLKWGTRAGEDESKLPGDDLLEGEVGMATHAITINAPPENVWPWIAQIGQNKAGFYSFTLLENMVGCHMRNANTVHPEWQAIKQGDTVLFHPQLPAQPVALLERNRHFVIAADIDQPFGSTWAFVLRDLGHGRTRLIVRLRWRMHKGLAHVGDLAFLEPAHFLMERKMMLTIKKLAEGKPIGPLLRSRLQGLSAEPKLS